MYPAPSAFGSLVEHPETMHPDEKLITDVPASPHPFTPVHAVHTPVALRWYAFLHVFLHAPDASGDTLEAFTSVVTHCTVQD